MWIFAFLIIPCYSANILGVFPNTGKSHHTLGEVILKRLAEKGHQVTMMSKFPQRQKWENFEDIELFELEITDDESFIRSFAKSYFIGTLLKYVLVTNKDTEIVLKNTGVQKLLKGNKKFDLILMDLGSNYAHLIFGHIYEAPIIAISPFGSTFFTNWIVGNPEPLAYVPHTFVGYNDQMTLFERIVNTLSHISFHVLLKFAIREQEKLLKKHFQNAPSIEKLAERVQLIFSNVVYGIEGVRTNVPNVIAIGGVHIGKPEALPKDLENYLNNSRNGVIYFSLGTNMKSIFLNKREMSVFIKTFSKLKMNVIWKYEGDAMPDKPENVKLINWVPQKDILAHPNVKLFITHGGILSITESIYHNVPILGIPIFGDQKSNVPRAVRNGYALQVDIEDISEEKLSWAIHEMMENPRYKNEMGKLSELMRNKLVHPLEEATFWVERVLKLGHANYLRSAGVNMPLYQHLLVDVIIVLIIIVLLPVLMLFTFIRIIRTKLSRHNEKKTKRN